MILRTASPFHAFARDAAAEKRGRELPLLVGRDDDENLRSSLTDRVACLRYLELPGTERDQQRVRDVRICLVALVDEHASAVIGAALVDIR